MKNLAFRLFAISILVLLFSIFTHGAGTDYVYDFQRPESFSFLVRNAWTQFIPTLVIYALVMVVITSIAYSCKKSKVKKDTTTIILFLIFFSYQVTAQTSINLDELHTINYPKQSTVWVSLIVIVSLIVLFIFVREMKHAFNRMLA